LAPFALAFELQYVPFVEIDKGSYMNKSSLISFILSFSFLSFAHAGFLSDRAQDIANRLKNAERQLQGRDPSDVRYALDQLDYILQRYDRGGNTSNFACISNGEPGSFEKFTITDLNTNQKLGSATSRATCEDLIQSQYNDLICLSNGEPGSFEKFGIYDFRTQKTLGAKSALNTCKSLVSRSSLNLVCLSNGEPGSFEKFTLFNRNTRQSIGAGTSISNCLSTIQ
jgi:hypothetical protein